MTSNDKPGDDKKKYVWLIVLALLALKYCVPPIITGTQQPQPVLATVTLTKCEQGIKDYIEFTDEFETRMENSMFVTVDEEFEAALDDLLEFVEDYRPAECVTETHEHLVVAVEAMKNYMLTTDPDEEALWEVEADESFNKWAEGMAGLAKKYGEDW